MTRWTVLSGILVAVHVGGIAAATELCRTHGTKLIVRDQCKQREETLTDARKAELGLEGPPGAAGPPGPPAGDLRLVDATGREIGVVISLDGYYGSADVVGEMTLPGRTSPGFVELHADGAGLSAETSCPGSLFDNPSCTGTAYSTCDYGACSPGGTGTFFDPIYNGGDGTACFLGDSSEVRNAVFSQAVRLRGTSPTEMATRCQQVFGGTLTTTPAPCRSTRVEFLCATCCGRQLQRNAVPVHTFDTSLVGTPPFRLTR